MTKYLIQRTTILRMVEVLEIDAPSEAYARLKAAELTDHTAKTETVHERLELVASVDMDADFETEVAHAC